MTNSDLKTNEAIQTISRKLKDQHKIDWEERKFLLMKDVVCALLSNNYYVDECVGMATKIVDNVLRELIDETDKK